MQLHFAWSLCLSVTVVLLSIIPLTLGRIKAGYSIENMSAPRAFFETDYRWLNHFGFDPLDVPTNYRGLSR